MYTVDSMGHSEKQLTSIKLVLGNPQRNPNAKSLRQSAKAYDEPFDDMWNQCDYNQSTKNEIKT